MRWLRWLTPRRRQQQRAAGNGDARAARASAERKLAEAKGQSAEVRRITARLRGLAADDFTAAVEAAMRRRHP